MNWLAENFGQVLEAASYICLAATVITSMTKSTSDDEWVNKLKKVLNLLAGNVGKNKNADDV